MRILRAPARPTLLQQGSKLEPEEAAKGMKTESARWITKRKGVLCKFCVHLSGSHFCNKDLSWGTKGQPKERKWEMPDGYENINDFYVNFARTCQDRTFAAKIQIGNPRDTKRNENGNSLMGEKNINDFYVDFARTCQDHILAARSQVGTSRDSQRNENGKCLMSTET